MFDLMFLKYRAILFLMQQRNEMLIKVPDINIQLEESCGILILNVPTEYLVVSI